LLPAKHRFSLLAIRSGPQDGSYVGLQLRIENQAAVGVAYARRGNYVNAVAHMIEQRSCHQEPRSIREETDETRAIRSP